MGASLHAFSIRCCQNGLAIMLISYTFGNTGCKAGLQKISELRKKEATVFAAGATDESPVDRIIERSDLPAHVVTATLMKLEMCRLVRAFPGFRHPRERVGRNYLITESAKPGIRVCFTHDRPIKTPGTLRRRAQGLLGFHRQDAETSSSSIQPGGSAAGGHGSGPRGIQTDDDHGGTGARQHRYPVKKKPPRPLGATGFSDSRAWRLQSAATAYLRRASSFSLALAMTSSATFFGQGA